MPLLFLFFFLLCYIVAVIFQFESLGNSSLKVFFFFFKEGQNQSYIVWNSTFIELKQITAFRFKTSFSYLYPTSINRNKTEALWDSYHALYLLKKLQTNASNICVRTTQPVLFSPAKVAVKCIGKNLDITKPRYNESVSQALRWIEVPLYKVTRACCELLFGILSILLFRWHEGKNSAQLRHFLLEHLRFCVSSFALKEVIGDLYWKKCWTPRK